MVATVRRDPRFRTDVLTSAVLDFGGRHASFTCSTQIEDGRIDTWERLSNVWQKATRGDIAGRFEKVKKVYLDDLKEPAARHITIVPEASV